VGWEGLSFLLKRKKVSDEQCENNCETKVDFVGVPVCVCVCVQGF